MAAIFWLWVSWGLFCCGVVMAGAVVYAADVDDAAGVDELKRFEVIGEKESIEIIEKKVDAISQSLLFLYVKTGEPTDRDVEAANRIADIMEKQWREIQEIYEKR